MCHGMTPSNEDVVMKLDMTKAYDRMEWRCITTVLEKLGFCRGWIDLVEKTINNVWYILL